MSGLGPCLREGRDRACALDSDPNGSNTITAAGGCLPPQRWVGVRHLHCVYNYAVSKSIPPCEIVAGGGGQVPIPSVLGDVVIFNHDTFHSVRGRAR